MSYTVNSVSMFNITYISIVPGQKHKLKDFSTLYQHYILTKIDLDKCITKKLCIYHPRL